MNKQKVDQWIPKAYEALATSGIAVNGEVDNGYRGQIAAFGASVAMGSLLSAVAFFSVQGSSAVERQKLMDAIYLLIKPEQNAPANLCDYVKARMNDAETGGGRGGRR